MPYENEADRRTEQNGNARKQELRDIILNDCLTARQGTPEFNAMLDSIESGGEGSDAVSVALAALADAKENPHNDGVITSEDWLVLLALAIAQE